MQGKFDRIGFRVCMDKPDRRASLNASNQTNIGVFFDWLKNKNYSLFFFFFYFFNFPAPNLFIMTKRRLDDSSFANVLRQKIKEDPVIKQQAGN